MSVVADATKNIQPETPWVKTHGYIQHTADAVAGNKANYEKTK